MGNTFTTAPSFDSNEVTIPTNPTQLFMLRVPPTPNIFSVSVSTDGTELLFTVGYSIRTDGRYFIVNTFNVYFVPISAVNAAGLAPPTVALNAFNNAVLVNTITAPPNSGPLTFTDSRFLKTDGYFWATAISSYGQQSAPTSPYRAPVAGNLINTAIPPNAVTVSVSKTSPVVDGVTLSLVKAQAVIPSDNQGVISVTMTSNGTGYTSPPAVAFTGGLAAGGVAATGMAQLNGAGQVVGVFIASSGSGYVTAPAISFTGGSGSLAAATAYLGISTEFDGFQLYLTNYKGGGQVEGPYVNASGQNPGTTAKGSFYMLPDAGHTTTFTFVSVSRAGIRSTAGAPTATLIV